MKPINTMAALALAAYAVIVLSACGKTSNSGSNASTPASNTCTVSYDGTLRDSLGRACTQGTSTCPAEGRYTNSQGQVIACTPGQQIYINTNYPYQQYSGQVGGCDWATQRWGVLYIPMIYQNQLVCVNTQWLQWSQSTQNYYYQNQGYYEYYPPYYPNQSYGCGGIQLGAAYTDPNSGFSIGGSACF